MCDQYRSVFWYVRASFLLSHMAYFKSWREGVMNIVQSGNPPYPSTGRVASAFANHHLELRKDAFHDTLKVPLIPAPSFFKLNLRKRKSSTMTKY